MNLPPTEVYHMLQLATNAAIEVWQSGPYEEITVQLWR